MLINCSICCGDINFVDQQISSTNCGHLFHYSCLQKWLDNNLTCPECRVKVDRNSFVKKIYANTHKKKAVVYKGVSDESMSIFKDYENQTTNLKEKFVKRITFLENRNLQLENDFKNCLKDKNRAKQNFLRLQSDVALARGQIKELQNKSKSIQAVLINFLKEIRLKKCNDEIVGSSTKKLRFLETRNKMLEKKMSSVVDMLQDSLNLASFDDLSISK